MEREWSELTEMVEAALPAVREQIGKRRSLFRDAYSGLEFRMPLCGLSCFELQKILDEQGVKTRQLIQPEIDDALNAQLGYRHFKTSGHVLLNIQEGDSTYLVDPTYSQFLKPFGIDPLLLEYEEADDYGYFPQEEAIVFSPEESGEVAEWLSTVVERFWAGHAGDKRYLAYLQSPYKQNTITTMSHTQLNDYFRAVYDISSYTSYMPSITSRT